ncbi:MAG: hypothetical protein AAB466_07710 [Verrucomicrobiota bacterium]
MKQKQHLQRLLILSGLCLALYYVAVYRPLAQRAEALDEPLTSLWRQLATANLQNDPAGGVDLVAASQNLRQARTWLAAMNRQSGQIEARIALEAEIRSRMKAPFQLVDFQNERQLRIEQLSQLAKQNQVALEPTVLAGLPEFNTETKEPALLWGQLGFASHLLRTAIQCKVPSIKTLHLPSSQSYPARGASQDALEEIPLHLELSGPMNVISKFLLSLPLRAEEIKVHSLPEAAPAKPAMFLDRFLLRKQSPDKAEEVSLTVRVCGFIYR